ncbi:pilus assembly PilX family protein [Thiocystis violacea]|uniref:pilus assembly PilX family protein n=1 Tax=Thiocystis violacea TaxID=13725 RepID=UPI001907D827|nr:PilX N-terminal domain-containing pilus assembly protein [Thiocystis violacea]MBK1723742.1 hypothetical protein [Thiocystis violacea]
MRKFAKQQAGVVLVVGLIFLLLMTIIGVTAIQSSTMQERMAGNASDRNEVFQSAEVALQTGEAQVINQDCAFLDSHTYARPDPDNVESWNGSEDVDSDFSSVYVLTRVPPQLSEDESGTAEDDETCGGFYFVTAKAESAKGMTVVVQSTVFKKY